MANETEHEQVALMPVERSYDVRAKQIIAFNECRKAGGDLDDALDAAYKVALRYTPAQSEQPAPVAVVLPELQTDFEYWWEEHGQYCRAGGGSYEKTFAYRAYEAALAEVTRLNQIKQ